jgi:hypothetical protein
MTNLNRKQFILGAALLGFASCSKQGSSPSSVSITGSASNQVLTQKAMMKFPMSQVVTADASYKVVDPQWIKGAFYDYFRKDLFDKGITKWDKKFDCDKFAKYFAALVQVKYFVDNFHKWTEGEALSIGELYYRIGGISGHAINVLFDGNDFTFFEPQTGQFVTLTNAELESVSLVKF